MRPVLLAMLIAGALTGPGAVGEAVAQRRGARDVAAWLENNRQQLLRYGWKQRIEVETGDGIELVRVDRVRHGPDGELRRFELESATGSDERGFLTRRRARKKRARVEEQERALRELLEAYVHMERRAREAAFSRAFVDETAPGSSGATRVQVRDVVHRGDSSSLWLDDDRLPLRLEVFTALDGEPVRMTGEFERLDGGPSYLARSVIETEMGEKRLVIRTTTFDVRPLEDRGR